jgi:hypothetical protein
MPIRVRNWGDPVQRLVYLLDRDLDKLVRAVQPPERTLHGAHGLITSIVAPPRPPAPRAAHKYIPPPIPFKLELKEKKSEPGAVKRKAIVGTCCDRPDVCYVALGHDWVCRNCGLCNHAGSEEVGDVVQFEQRAQCSSSQSASLPYDRNKHFKKILRDATNMHIRIPRALVLRMRSEISGKMTVAKVRNYLRAHKLYHYYTSSNNLARVLGDTTHRVHLDTRAFHAMCIEADALSHAFERMKKSGLIRRKNFVNTNVLILEIAKRKFALPEIKKFLRLPRATTLKKHEEIIDQIYAFMRG